MSEYKELIKQLVDRFLSWSLPLTVCSDLCVTDRDYRFPRLGTNLLTANEAKQMIEYLLADKSITTFARAEALEEAAKECDEWADTVEKFGKRKSDAFGYRVVQPPPSAP